MTDPPLSPKHYISHECERGRRLKNESLLDNLTALANVATLDKAQLTR